MVQIVSLPKKLLWSQIKDMYQNEWVELVDCDWQPDSASPKRAIVKNHAPERADLMKMIQKENSRSVVLFVGLADSVVSFDFSGVAA